MRVHIPILQRVHGDDILASDCRRCAWGYKCAQLTRCSLHRYNSGSKTARIAVYCDEDATRVTPYVRCYIMCTRETIRVRCNIIAYAYACMTRVVCIRAPTM